jgi:hypothetical protein
MQLIGLLTLTVAMMAVMLIVFRQRQLQNRAPDVIPDPDGRPDILPSSLLDDETNTGVTQAELLTGIGTRKYGDLVAEWGGCAIANRALTPQESIAGTNGWNEYSVGQSWRSEQDSLASFSLGMNNWNPLGGMNPTMAGFYGHTYAGGNTVPNGGGPVETQYKIDATVLDNAFGGIQTSPIPVQPRGGTHMIKKKGPMENDKVLSRAVPFAVMTQGGDLVNHSFKQLSASTGPGVGGVNIGVLTEAQRAIDNVRNSLRTATDTIASAPNVALPALIAEANTRVSKAMQHVSATISTAPGMGLENNSSDRAVLHEFKNMKDIATWAAEMLIPADSGIGAVVDAGESLRGVNNRLLGGSETYDSVELGFGSVAQPDLIMDPQLSRARYDQFTPATGQMGDYRMNPETLSSVPREHRLIGGERTQAQIQDGFRGREAKPSVQKTRPIVQGQPVETSFGANNLPLAYPTYLTSAQLQEVAA